VQVASVAGLVAEPVVELVLAPVELVVQERLGVGSLRLLLLLELRLLLMVYLVAFYFPSIYLLNLISIIHHNFITCRIIAHKGIKVSLGLVTHKVFVLAISIVKRL
jgi:hypothetical protein